MYEGVSKSFRTGRLQRELQIVQLSAIRCSCIAILWVSLVCFIAITLCVTSQQVFIVVSVYFVVDSVRKLLLTPFHNWCSEIGMRLEYESSSPFSWNAHGNCLLSLYTIISCETVLMDFGFIQECLSISYLHRWYQNAFRELCIDRFSVVSKVC
jgi:hypothetical protein